MSRCVTAEWIEVHLNIEKSNIEFRGWSGQIVFAQAPENRVDIMLMNLLAETLERTQFLLEFLAVVGLILRARFAPHRLIPTPWVLIVKDVLCGKSVVDALAVNALDDVNFVVLPGVNCVYIRHTYFLFLIICLL
ncbi:hypothetical protein D3C71_1507170 [compost metagenome]